MNAPTDIRTGDPTGLHRVLDDAVVLHRHLEFIKRLGEAYDGHPDVDHVDIGSIGWWGEWQAPVAR